MNFDISLCQLLQRESPLNALHQNSKKNIAIFNPNVLISPAHKGIDINFN